MSAKTGKGIFQLNQHEDIRITTKMFRSTKIWPFFLIIKATKVLTDFFFPCFKLEVWLNHSHRDCVQTRTCLHICLWSYKIVLDYGMCWLFSPREWRVLPTILSLTRNMDYLDKSSFTPFLTSEKKALFFFFFLKEKVRPRAKLYFSTSGHCREAAPVLSTKGEVLHGKTSSSEKVYSSLFWIWFRNHQEVTKSQQNCG